MCRFRFIDLFKRDQLTVCCKFDDTGGLPQASVLIVLVDGNADHVGSVRLQVGQRDGGDVEVVRKLGCPLLATVPLATVCHLELERRGKHFRQRLNEYNCIFIFFLENNVQ